MHPGIKLLDEEGGMVKVIKVVVPLALSQVVLPALSHSLASEALFLLLLAAIESILLHAVMDVHF